MQPAINTQTVDDANSAETNSQTNEFEDEIDDPVIVSSQENNNEQSENAEQSTSVAIAADTPDNTDNLDKNTANLPEVTVQLYGHQ